MSDRPIIFSAPMIRALLAGTKTQTRLVLKPAKYSFENNIRLPDGANAGEVQLTYHPGDRLWVREAHYLTDDGDNETAVYAEDACEVQKHLNQIAQMQIGGGLSDDWAAPHLRLRPSIHMPRWASRLTLTVTDVRVQRVQDISAQDCSSEGIPCSPDVNPRHEYQALWNSLHGPGAWESNPWVVAVSFTVHRGNIDEVK